MMRRQHATQWSLSVARGVITARANPPSVDGGEDRLLAFRPTCTHRKPCPENTTLQNIPVQHPMGRVIIAMCGKEKTVSKVDIQHSRLAKHHPVIARLLCSLRTSAIPIPYRPAQRPRHNRWLRPLARGSHGRLSGDGMIEIVLSENLGVSWLLEEFGHRILSYPSVNAFQEELPIHVRST